MSSIMYNVMFFLLPLAITLAMFALDVRFALRLSLKRALLFGALVGAISFLGLELILWIGTTDYFSFNDIFIDGSRLSWVYIYFDVMNGGYDGAFAAPRTWQGIQLLQCSLASIFGMIIVLEAGLLKFKWSVKIITLLMLAYSFRVFLFALISIWEEQVFSL